MGESRSGVLRTLGEGWDLASMASHFGLSITSAAADATKESSSVDKGLRTWLDLLVTWNAKHDLTAARSEGELLDLMLADAFALSSHLRGPAPKAGPGADHVRLVDIGSGAGAPGLPLALLRPDLAVTLVEPLPKRVSFLRTVTGALGRLDVKVHRGKVGELTGGETMWDIAISRATFPPPEWLAVGRTLVPSGGSVWVLLAREEPPAALEGMTIAEDFAYTWPNQQRARRAVRYVAG